jgi:hypothetical protein
LRRLVVILLTSPFPANQDHATYFKALDEEASARREEQFRRWKEVGGGKVGVSEFVIRGGDEVAESDENKDEKKEEGQPKKAAADQAGSEVEQADASSGDAVETNHAAEGPEEFVTPPTSTPNLSTSAGTGETESSGQSGETNEVKKD